MLQRYSSHSTEADRGEKKQNTQGRTMMLRNKAANVSTQKLMEVKAKGESMTDDESPRQTERFLSAYCYSVVLTAPDLLVVLSSAGVLWQVLYPLSL